MAWAFWWRLVASRLCGFGNFFHKRATIIELYVVEEVVNLTECHIQLLLLLELGYNTSDSLCTNGHFSNISLISRDRVKIT
jgi:hypothetical protein